MGQCWPVGALYDPVCPIWQPHQALWPMGTTSALQPITCLPTFVGAYSSFTIALTARGPLESLDTYSSGIWAACLYACLQILLSSHLSSSHLLLGVCRLHLQEVIQGGMAVVQRGRAAHAGHLQPLHLPVCACGRGQVGIVCLCGAVKRSDLQGDGHWAGT